jgi:hypothetical protein
MATLEYQRTLRLVVVQCCECFIEYGIPDEMNQRALQKTSNVNVYCPNGHQWHYIGKSLEEQLRAAKAQAVQAADQQRAAERQVSAMRGEMTKLRKRAAAGVCPCCKRSFVNVRRHMTSKHPDYADR